jgi:hypothetical protein
MGLLGIGGGKSSSSQSSSSAANGENWSAQTSIGGGYQGSESAAVGGSQATASSQDRLAFEQLYGQLYGDASGVAGGMAQNPFLSTTANDLFSSGQGILGGLQGDAGSAYLKSVLGSNENVNEQIDLLGQDIGKFTSEQLLPNIRRSSAAAGQLGGSRQSVAEGSAIEGSQRAFASGVSDIRNANLQRQLQAGSQLSSQNLQGAQIGLAGNESLYGLANQGFMSQLSPYAALASIMGDKTTLGSSMSNSTSFDQAISSAFGEDFNESNAWSYGYDQATSKSKGKQSSWNLGLKFG